jgi:hypothetical protein
MKYVLLVLILISLAVAPAFASVPDDLQCVSVIRRIHAWAKASKIEWTIDPTVPMPSLKEIDAIPAEDVGQSPGGYPDRNPAGAPDEGGMPALKPPFDFDKAVNWVERLFNRAGRRSS